MAARRQTQSWRRLAATCLLRWHLCSLDAPTVAVVWALTLARTAGARLQLKELLVLGLGTWVVYVLDRVLDGIAGPGHSPTQRGRLQQRHHFHARHRRLLLGLCVAAAGLVALLCRRLPLLLVETYAALGVPVVAYCLCVHARLVWPALAQPARRDSQPRMRKEAAVALLFTAAVAAPSVVTAPVAQRWVLLVPILLLAGLCWLNCALISHAQASVPGASRSHSPTDLRRERRGLRDWTLALLCTAAAAWALGLGDRPQRISMERWSGPMASLPVILSCLLLLYLLAGMGSGEQTPSDAGRLRVLADISLLTPLLFLRPHF